MKFCNGPCNSEKPFEAFHKGTGSFGLKTRCKECSKLYKPNSSEYKRKWYLNNKDKARENRRRHQRNNREEYRRRNSEYDKAHKPERAAREAFRRAQKLKATPKWLTSAQIDEMKALYVQRDVLRGKTGIIYHVDHIIPLVSETVCGLHVPWNLEIMVGTLNSAKGNRYGNS